MKNINGKFKEHFINWLRDYNSYWIYRFLPNYFQGVFIVLFLSESGMVLDINYWSDGFDWALSKKHRDEVLVSNRSAGNRFKTYNDALNDALLTANRVYNGAPNLYKP